MKITAILLLSLPVVAAAQTIDRHVVASSGKQYSTSVGSMGYTIGEPLTNTLVGGTATFTQGFHQGTINITSVRQQLPLADINVYPNPTVNAVQVRPTAGTLALACSPTGRTIFVIVTNCNAL